MKNNVGTDEKFDGLVCQLSTNDASKRNADGKNLAVQKVRRILIRMLTGAMEYIIVYAKQTWNCPVIFDMRTKI